MTALLAATALLALPTPYLQAQNAAGRQLLNPEDVHDEVKVAAGNLTAVKDFFPSFLEYQDLVMFHPKFGYYASGRVSFTEDYQTFPNVLSPYFGQMIAEQALRMWSGMRRAGTLGDKERFVIAEFGAGNGTLAESILDYLNWQAEHSSDKQWHEFAAQVLYVCYDRSPALSKTQRDRNARFGEKFEAREADATEPTATIAPGSLKGIVLSNELPDAFSVYKVILQPNGSAEVAYVVPWLPQDAWNKIKKEAPANVVEEIAQGDRAVKAKFFPEGQEQATFLTRSTFKALLEALAPTEHYTSAANSIEFHEVYVPASAVPEVSEHLRRYARDYAGELARKDGGVVAYINLGAEKFIQGAGRVLKAGYLVTLDYGATWDGILAADGYPRLRTFGPARREANLDMPAGTGWDGSMPEMERETSDPYRGPTLNDLTTDVNFSLMDAAGRLVGLKTVFYGAQRSLQSGTSISLNAPPQGPSHSMVSLDVFQDWAGSFITNDNYRLLVQQKEGTDSEYRYPDHDADRVGADESKLSEAQRERSAEIEKQLAPSPQPALQ